MSFKKRVNKTYILCSKESEAALPTSSMQQMKYYHGTPTKQKADKVWREGIKPDLSTTEGTSKPIPGRVYCTQNLKEALIYAVGYAFTPGEPINLDVTQQHGKFGYLFVLKGKQFKDIHPDEDQVGKAVYEKFKPWLTALAEKHLDGVEPDDIETSAYEDLLKDVYLGDYTAWIQAGKILLPYLTDKQKIEIIKKYGNVAHEGVLYPSEMWQIDRTQIQNLDDDLTNFFKVAKLIEKR